ncbi:hypothetical protein BO94DRAFT_622116 [Aspergillus sclerotioniger CBS 115572]|uniref:Methyltransferase domain-containing protein n=1 Tax=Aspergillus sclerotioniger CBS 115572 TaxID=1450535 RepID=A0A317X6G8_9EURO|nr:hypothetical protein BO94DRAFT_622116 [Aspergillus sclerotioniger CBS 115572]PWY93761.1 hypothetical protein BO94DRAFT_622116 [Aspergillus sclerotioniger CBS 115572]
MSTLTDTAASIARLSLHDPTHFNIQYSQTLHRLTLLQHWDITPGSTILELGCGQGDCTTVLASAVGEHGKVVAVDPADLDYGSPYTLSEAQSHITSGPLGPNITWIHQSPLPYLSSLPLPPTPQPPPHSTQQSSPTASAEWSLLATHPSAQPHVLAALAQASLECRKDSDSSASNVRTVLSPKRLTELAVEAGWRLEREAVVPCNEGLLDGRWEVGACLSGGFEREVKMVVKGERERAVVWAARDACESPCRQLSHPRYIISLIASFLFHLHSPPPRTNILKHPPAQHRKMTSLEAFCRAQREEEYPTPPEMLTALELLFTDPSVSVSTAARIAMTPIIIDEGINPTPEPNLSDFWIMFFKAVGLFTNQNDHLLEFLLAIQSLPDCNGGFRKLPGLDEYLMEFVFDYIDHPFNLPYTDPIPELTDTPWLNLPSHRDIQRQAWLNVNRLTANLHLRSKGSFLEYGGLTVRKTLEKAPWEIFHHADLEEHLSFVLNVGNETEYNREKDDVMERIDIRTLDGWVPAAAVWFRVCGKEMYEVSRVGEEEMMFGEWKGSKWVGRPGWSRERWMFWKERWGWIAGVTALNRRTREIARDVVVVMGRVESEGE